MEQGQTGLVGAGMLGRAIATAWLESGTVAPDDLVVLTRSGRAGGLEALPDVTVTTDPDLLAARCGTILMCVPPAEASETGLHAPDALILSVMAGIRINDLTRLTGARRVIRAMSSPAAARGLAYTPYVAGPGTDEADCARARVLFGACGATDAMEDEALLDHFTAMTGPVPGFVAFFADAMVAHAISVGTPPEVADRAIRQLFLAGGQMLAEDPMQPGQHVRQMIDYAGTTAAGLEALEASTTRQNISEALHAAAARARAMRPS